MNNIPPELLDADDETLRRIFASRAPGPGPGEASREGQSSGSPNKSDDGGQSHIQSKDGKPNDGDVDVEKQSNGKV